MSFNDLVRKSGKGLDISKELVIALEVNLGGTLGTQYFADKNINIEGTYYDGRLMSTSSVNRRIFPDVGSFEISGLETRLANHDNEFYKPKWVRWSHGQPAKLKIGFHGTRDMQQADFTTRYNGILQNMEYDFDVHTTDLTFEDRSQKILRKLLPDRLVNDTSFPGRHTTTALAGTPIPFVYGGFYENLGGSPNYLVSVPGIVVGTYTEGTTRILRADHGIYTGYSDYFFQDGASLHGTYIAYNNGTIASHGTRPISYIDLNHDPGTSIISQYMIGKWKTGYSYISSYPIRDILSRAGLSDPDEIGTLSFDKFEALEIAHRNGTWGNGHIYLDEQKSIKEILEDFCSQKNCIIYFDSQGRANIKPYFYSCVGTTAYHSYGYTEEGTRELDEDDFLSFQAYKDASHVINQTQTLYHYCPYGDLFSYFGQIDHKASQTRLGYTKTKKTEAYWLYGTGGHYRQDWAYLGRFRYPIYKARFRLHMSALPLELANYVELTHSEAPNEYGTQGWQQKQMEIVSIEEDFNNAVINCEAWEWGLPIPTWRLSTWFSLAEGDGTHIYPEFDEHWGNIDEIGHFTTNGTESSFWANKIGNDYVLTLNGSDQFVCGLNNGTTAWGNVDGFAHGLYGAFVKPDNLSNQQCIMSSNNLGTNGWEFGINTDGSIYYGVGYINTKTSGTYIEISSQAGDISGPGTWQMLCVGPSRKNMGEANEELWVKFYLNGTQLGTFLHVGNYVTSGGEQTNTKADAIGASNVTDLSTGGVDIPCKYFDGQIGDVVAYPVGGTRSAADMEKLFNGLRGRYGL